MYLNSRIAMNVDGASTSSVSVVGPEEPQNRDAHVYSFMAEFLTDQRAIRAELTSPEIRLSDHLNSSTTSVDIRPSSVTHGALGPHIDLPGTSALLTKALVRLVIPIAEPERPRGAGNAAWKPTVQRNCWMGIGAYRVDGTIHTEAGRDPHRVLRLLDKQFLPVTRATVSYPDGTSHEYDTVIVNRFHLDMLAIKDR